MADFTQTVYQSGRAIAAAPNLTDNKTAATSSNNYYVPGNDGNIVLYLKAGTTSNVTIATPGNVDGNAIADLVIALPDSDAVIVGPFPQNPYNDAQGRMLVTVSANTDIMAIRVP